MLLRITANLALLLSCSAGGQQSLPDAAPDARGVASPTTSSESVTDARLATRIEELLRNPAVAGAHWGIAVTTLAGTPLYAREEDKFFRPASTLKLFTTAAVLASLGPEKRFVTQLVAEGRLQDGTLHGNLVLVGGGDSGFGAPYTLPYTVPLQRRVDPLTDVDDLVNAAVAKGLRQIDGAIIGDDSRFEYAPYAPGIAEEDLLWGYGAPVSALILDDNAVDLTVTGTGGRGQPASVSMRPSLPFYAVNAKPFPGTDLVPSVTVTADGGTQLGIRRVPQSRDLAIYGHLSAKSGPAQEQISIDAPAEYAALALQQALLSHGVVASNPLRTREYGSGAPRSSADFLHAVRSPNLFAERIPAFFSPASIPDCEAQRTGNLPEAPRQVLAEHRSPPLLEDIVYTLKTSDNLHAEVMLRNLGVEKDCMSGTLATTGPQLVRQYLLRAGLGEGDFVFYDGSGLSTKDLVTPRGEVKLLAYAAAQPWFPQWKAALPVGGVDGTLSSRFTQSPLKGHLFAKTGTLGESRALAGYVLCRSGREVIFAILDDNHEPGSSADRVAMDKMVEAIADLN